MGLQLPQYLQKLNPSAAILSDAVPKVELTGVKNLGLALKGALGDIQTYRDASNISKVKKEYEQWLVQEKKDFEMNADINSIETQCDAFNTNATNKIDELTHTYGISWKRREALIQQMQEQYVPNNLAYSIKISDNVKAKAFENDEIQYANELNTRFASASIAQLRGDSGAAFLEQSFSEIDSQVDAAVASGYIPNYVRDNLLLKKKMQATEMFLGRMLKEDPTAAYNLVTHNARTILVDQGAYYKKHKSDTKYQDIYSSSQEGFEEYQSVLQNLDKNTQVRLGLRPLTYNNETVLNSNKYNLGAIYKQASLDGISFSEALNNEAYLRKYTTPFAPTFSTSSVYLDADTADFAGIYRQGHYTPAHLNPNSKYFNQSMRYLSLQTSLNVQTAYPTYLSSAKKEQANKAALASAQAIRDAGLAVEADNITGDVPTQVIRPAKSTRIDMDPYNNIPAPVVNVPKEEIKDKITKKATEMGVPTGFALAVFDHESGFNYKARGGCGEYGLGQLMPATAKSLGIKNPWDIDENITGALKYMKMVLDKANGDVKAAYAGYNGGPGRIAPYAQGKIKGEIHNHVQQFYKTYLKYKEQ